jgi:phosphohistidine phosphatase
MNVYLVRHAHAVTKEEDPQRPLSEQGRAAVGAVASHLASGSGALLEIPISEVFHSGKLRAQQTAAILANALCPGVIPSEADDLDPDDDPRAWAKRLRKRRDESTAIMLVGHMPHLTYLAGRLLAPDEERPFIDIATAGALRLHAGADGWLLDWYLTPECLSPERAYSERLVATGGGLG